MKITMQEVKRQPLRPGSAAQSHQPWTEAEERQLLLEWERGETIGTIAEIHGRSDKGIISRLNRLSVPSTG